MHYQLFLPESTKPAEGNHSAWLASVGLEDHCDGFTPMMGEGPDGKGVLIGWTNSRSNNRQVTYRPESQTWVKSLPLNGQEAGRYWVGFDNENPPTQSELRRPYTQSGEFLQLGKEKWKIPTLHTAPKEAQYQDDGSWHWVPVREFAWLVDEATTYREELITNREEKLIVLNKNPAEFINWIVRLLRVNYHMLPEVAAHLHMFPEEHVVRVLLRSLSMVQSEDEDDA